MPTQPGGNIRCVTNPGEPVIGYFSASTLQQRRVFFTRQDIKGPSGLYDPTGYEKCYKELLPLDQVSGVTLQGKLVNDAAYNLLTGELIGYIVLPEECVDCRMKGGITIKPDYWE